MQSKVLEVKISRRRAKLSKIEPEASDKRSKQMRPEIEALEKERNERVESPNRHDKKIQVGNLPEDQGIHSLPVDSRYFLDHLRMAVYRISRGSNRTMTPNCTRYGRAGTENKVDREEGLFQYDNDMIMWFLAKRKSTYRNHNIEKNCTWCNDILHDLESY